MVTPAFDARFVRSALLSIGLYFSVIAILLTMFRHVHAEGIVNVSGTPVLPYQMCSTNYKNYWCVPIAGDIPTLTECLALANIIPNFHSKTYVNIQYAGCWWGLSSYANQYSQCPVNSTLGLPIRQYQLSCTCKDNFKPDAAGTSCVPEVTCPIDPLPKPPFKGDADPTCTASLEKGAGKDVDHKCPDLTADMQAGESCLADKIHALAITYTEPSATVRTTAYQNHLLDVWKWNALIANTQKDWSDAEKQACAAVIADVKDHMTQHGLDSDPSSSGDDAPHVRRNAIDIPRAVARALKAQVTTTTTVPMLPGCLSCGTATTHNDVEDYVNSATANPPACSLRWGGRFFPVDNVHFQLP